MTQKPGNQPLSSSSDDDEEPTETRIPARQFQIRQREDSMQVRQSKAFTFSIDEHGAVRLFSMGQLATLLQPEEAYDLLDFLFAYRNFLAARSSEVAEQF